MKIITIGFGVLLILLGVGSYIGTGMTSLTALIPAFFGVAYLYLGLHGTPRARAKKLPLVRGGHVWRYWGFSVRWEVCATSIPC